jgi:hypothetical protein
MSGRNVDAREVLLDIRHGIKDSELMTKYKLSQKGLEDLHRQLSQAGLLKTVSGSRLGSEPRKINAAAITNDILAGMSDGELMERYALSVQDLQKVFKKLLQSGVSLPRKVGSDDKSSSQLTDAKPEEVRLTFRQEVDFVLPIFDEKAEEVLGTVLNITEIGLGVRGISSRVGERRTLVIPADEFFDVGRLTVEATCRWSAMDPSDGEPLAGFELVPQSRANIVELRKLISLIETMRAVETTEFKNEGEPARESRRAVRYNCPFPVPIHDALQAGNKGRILNVSAEGLAVEGMTWQEADKKTLVIPAYQYGRRYFKSIVLIAEFRWARQVEGEESVSGLRITDRTAKNYEEFQELVRACASAEA